MKITTPSGETVGVAPFTVAVPNGDGGPRLVPGVELMTTTTNTFLDPDGAEALGELLIAVARVQRLEEKRRPR